MKILLVGDIVGGPGRRAFAAGVARLRERGEADVVVVNAENAAGGRGLTAPLAEELFAAGADAITLGDHTWDQKPFVSYLEQERRVVRPANFAPGCPGRGWVTVGTALGPVTVVNLIGRVFMKPYDCPFRTCDRLIDGEIGEGVVIVDMHAEATSEKIALGRYLDGRAACVAGTHTHVQTSDETVLPGGTAYITDLGMTGSKESVLGRDVASVTAAFLTGQPARFKLGRGDVAMEGAVVTVDRVKGRATAIRRVRERMPEGGDRGGTEE